MNQKFLKPYDSQATEGRIYELWEQSGYFDPDRLPERNQRGEPFSVVLPPPNVTGVLHMGSALMLAIEDIMVRYARMQGKRAVWIPGTDHAAIATQAVVEKKIQKEEGKSRHDLGRDELLGRIGSHVSETHDVIVAQMREMGASIDWSREAFTLDEERSMAVRTAFKKMYDDGLIYRGHRVVNWDPKSQTTISDDEIVYEPRKAKLYTFKYSKDIPISISTTRPETKLGDTAIAVHPDDERYQAYIGKEFSTTFAGEPITLRVIADRDVDKEFGTGALGVTPAHSSIDWEMAQRHDLPLKQVIDEYARMTVGFDGKDAPHAIKGAKTAEAREAVVEWLRAEGLLEKEEEIDQNVATAQRSGAIIEPLPKLQWFVAVNSQFTIHNSQIPGIESGSKTTLKELMKQAVSSGAIEVIPDRFEKVYFNWIDNLRDWCISRQIWYGHRIPVWYRETQNSNLSRLGGIGKTQKSETPLVRRSSTEGRNEGRNPKSETDEEIFVGLEAPEGEGWVQDEDTLDTWFSSGLWTFSTLGWPRFADTATRGKPGKENDLANFHPTTILETGSDILFFWVARMILMSGYLLGDVPFRTVYLHGLVRDTKNRKISKSLGNNIDPVDMIATYGADAVRMSLVVSVGPGNDSKVDEQKIKAYKLFSNKLWNVARFVISAAEGERYDREKGETAVSAEKIGFDPDFRGWHEADKAHLERLNLLIAEITGEMDEYKFYLVGEKLYHYAWHELADVILEESKPIIGGADTAATASRIQFLLHALHTLLRALHPFMPYLTEEIWSEFRTGTMLIVEEWPHASAE